MKNHCTLYSHTLAFNTVLELVKSHFPNALCHVDDNEGGKTVQVQFKGKLFKSTRQMNLSYRERAQPSYKIESIDSPLTQNLSGMLGFVSELQSSNETIRELLLQKISTLNCELAIMQDGKLDKEVNQFVAEASQKLDAIAFVPADSPLTKAQTQHFLDRDLNLILDMHGNCEIDSLDVRINSEYFDAPQEELTADQTSRKEKSQDFLVNNKIQINKNLPAIASEERAQIRSVHDIATRLTVMAVTSYVAFNAIDSDEALQYLEQHQLLANATPIELAFLNNPTDELKQNETWKCECIWTLLWALTLVDELPHPKVMSDLNTVNPDHYLKYHDQKPEDYINSKTNCRSIAAILDAKDLYYRMHWTCVDARMSGIPADPSLENHLEAGVVYERLYALNWLTSETDEAWDDIVCNS